MWSKITIEKDKTYYWKIGCKEIFIKKNEKEWFVSQRENKDSDPKLIYGEERNAGNDQQWQVIIGEKSNTLVPVPTLPDRSVVVKTSHPFKVMPGKSAQLYIPVPLWIQYYATTRKAENLFFESPAQALSSTWVGESDGGTLAYSLNVDFFNSLQKPAETFHHIICPIKLTNDSPGVLDIQRLLLELEYLSVYADGDQLYANEIRMKFKGENMISDVQISAQPLASLGKPVQVSPPRNTKSQNVITKSFHFIKSLTNY